MTNLSGINLDNGSAVGSQSEGMDSPSHSLALMPKYDEYKRTPVDWIESIPSHWNFWRFKYLLKEINIRSTTGSEELLSLSKYKGVIPKDSLAERAGAAESLVGYKKVFINDLVINKMQAVNGLLAVSKMEGITSPDYSVYRPKDPDLIDYRYLGYLLSMPEYLGEFKRRVTGVMEGFIRLYTDDLFAICSIIPPHNEQTSIADFLDKKTAQVDDAIAIKEQQISLLKERKQIIIQQAVTQGLDPNVPMKDSGVDWIGKIPAHWEMKRVKNIFRLVMQPSEKNNDYELLSVYTDIGVKPRRELEERGNKASTTDGYWFVKKGDIVVNKLLAWMGAIGLSEYEGVTSPAYDILRPKLPINGFFYHYLFRSDFCSAELKRHSRGIMDMRLRLYFDRFGVVEVPYPPVDEQNEIIHSLETEMKEMDKGIEHLNTQIEKLKEYKTTLINSAVTGKIKITPEMVEQ
ncbi:restriction endonuclease subunit S [Vibrio cholerae]|nr:restriction endonuclease subunit S [Vibrio cholerae]